MANIYKKPLVADIAEKKRDEQHQVALRKKYKEPDENIRIVEKSNMAKFTIRTIGRVIQIIAYVLLIILAAIGVIAIIYPDTREGLFAIKDQMMEQLHQLIPSVF